MADFDPDAYLAGSGSGGAAVADFDPDAYLAGNSSTAIAGFDPDAYLKGAPAAEPVPLPPPESSAFLSAKTGVYPGATAYASTPDQVAAMRKPLIPAPDVQISETDPQLLKAGKAALNTVGDFVSGMSSVAGLLGVLIPPVGIGEMASGVPDLISQVEAADKTPAGSAERWQAGTNVLGFMGLLAAGAKGLEKGKAGTPRETVSTAGFDPDAYLAEQPPVQTSEQSATVGVGAPPAEATGAVALQPETISPQGGETSNAETIYSDQGQVSQGSQAGQQEIQGSPEISRPDLQQQAPTQPGGPEPVVSSPEPPARTIVSRPPFDAFGNSAVTPVANAVTEMGGIISKSEARSIGKYEGNTALWDNIPTLAHPTHNKVYKPGGEMPDVMAQNLYDAGLIQQPHPEAMWTALQQESKTTRASVDQAKVVAAEGAKITKQGQAFDKAQMRLSRKSKPPIAARDLQVGDKLNVEGEKLKVADIDPDTFDVTLEDGSKFGVQTVTDNAVIYGEYRPVKRKPFAVTSSEIFGFGPGTAASGEIPPWLPSQSDFEDAANSSYKMRGHVATVKRMVDVSPDTKARVESWYIPTNLKEVKARANGAIDQMGLGAATEKFMGSRTMDADTAALGHAVALRLDSLGRYDEASMVRENMAEKLTGPAQMMWFQSTIAKTSPEGLIREAQRVVTDQIRNDPEKMALLKKIQDLQAQLAQLPKKARPVATEIAIRNVAKRNMPGLSPAQLADLLGKNARGELTPQQLSDFLAKYYGIPKLSEANIAKIKAAQKAYADAEAKGNPLMIYKRGADMMDAVYSLVPSPFWSKVRAAAVLSMIVHGRMPVRIGVSNILQMLGQTYADAIQSMTIDPLVSIFSGKRTVTGPELKARMSGLTAPADAFRAGYTDAAARELGTIKSFKEGARTLLDLSSMTTGGIVDVGNLAARSRHVFSSRFGRLAEDVRDLLHNAVPYSVWTAEFKASLARQMRIAGADTPTAEMVGSARLDANKGIFNNDTIAFKMLGKIRDFLDLPAYKLTKGKYGLGTATVPFLRKPAAIVTEGIKWSPLGFLQNLWEPMRTFVVHEPFRQKEFGEAFVKAATGTGLGVATGYWLAKLGVLSGAPDANKDLDAMRRATGWGQYRINVSELKRRMLALNFSTKSNEGPQNGDLLLSYNWVEPFAFPIAMGADIAHSQDKREIDLKRGKITSTAAYSAVKAGVGTITDNPMLQGINNITTAWSEGDPGKAAIQIAANVPGNFIPSLARQTSQYLDNTVRETRGGTLLDAATSRILAQIPGLSEKYPARYDVLGQAIQRYDYGDKTLLNIFFNPANPTRFRDNKDLAEMERLFGSTGSTTGLPSQVNRTITINSKQVQLDNLQLATYQRYVGRQGAALMARLLASPAFAAEPAQVKQNVIGTVLSAVNTAAKIDLFGQRPVSVSPGGLHGPSIRGPSVLDVGAVIAGRRAGLTAPVSPVNP